MRVVIGCLAAIGLAVVLLVVGCVGLIGVGIATAAKDIPPYATRAAISQRHAADLALISEAITRRQYDGLADKLSAEVLAIYRGDDELLHRHVITNKSYWMMNDGGVGTLTSQGRTLDCVVLSLAAPAGAPAGQEHKVFFIDRQAQAVEKPAGEKP